MKYNKTPNSLLKSKADENVYGVNVGKSIGQIGKKMCDLYKITFTMKEIKIKFISFYTSAEIGKILMERTSE